MVLDACIIFHVIASFRVCHFLYVISAHDFVVLAQAWGLELYLRLSCQFVVGS